MGGTPPFFVAVAFPSDQLSPLLTLSGGFPANAVDPKNAKNPNAVGHPQQFPLPYVHQWSLTRHRELPGNWVLEAAYTGHLRLKPIGEHTDNQPLPGPE